MYICVGGNGYNGGAGANGFNGGDATHIAITNNRGVLANYKSNQSEVLLVAGGGGGSNDIGTGGTGGGSTGGTGETVNYSGTEVVGATGGTQNSGGTFPGNLGNSQTIVNGSFGLGGYSQRGTDYGGGGGGGSGHINTSKITNGSMQSGVREGTGYAKITWMPVQ